MEDHNNTIIDRKRIRDRGIDEFIGICKGIIFDGLVNYQEATNLLTWLDNNKLVAYDWTAKELYQKLPLLLDGNDLSPDDEAQFLSLLLKITGSPSVMMDGDNPSTQLPLCNPAPKVVFDGRVFVITGNLKWGQGGQLFKPLKTWAARWC